MCVVRARAQLKEATNQVTKKLCGVTFDLLSAPSMGHSLIASHKQAKRKHNLHLSMWKSINKQLEKVKWVNPAHCIVVQMQHHFIIHWWAQLYYIILYYYNYLYTYIQIIEQSVKTLTISAFPAANTPDHLEALRRFSADWGESGTLVRLNCSADGQQGRRKCSSLTSLPLLSAFALVGS